MEPPSPTASWLGEKALFVDCFGEAVGREKLDRAEIIAVSVQCVCVCVCVCVYMQCGAIVCVCLACCIEPLHKLKVSSCVNILNTLRIEVCIHKLYLMYNTVLLLLHCGYW